MADYSFRLQTGIVLLDTQALTLRGKKRHKILATFCKPSSLYIYAKFAAWCWQKDRKIWHRFCANHTSGSGEKWGSNSLKLIGLAAAVCDRRWKPVVRFRSKVCCKRSYVLFGDNGVEDLPTADRRSSVGHSDNISNNLWVLLGLYHRAGVAPLFTSLITRPIDENQRQA